MVGGWAEEFGVGFFEAVFEGEGCYVHCEVWKRMVSMYIA